MLNFLLVILFGFLGVILFIFFIYLLGEAICLGAESVHDLKEKIVNHISKKRQWRDWYTESNPIMSFKDFKAIYDLNPERWNFSAGFCGTSILYRGDDRKTNITFNYPDYKRYLKFLKELEKEEKRKKEISKNNLIIPIIEQAQKDIEQMRLKISKERLNTAETISEIQKNLNK